MKHLQSINKYLLTYRYRLLAGILFIVLSNFFGVLAPVFIRSGIDLVLHNAKLISAYDQTLIPPGILDNFYSGVLYFSMLTIILAFMRGVFLFFMRQTIIVMSRYIEYDQKNELFAKYQSLDVLFYKKNFTGDLMTRLTEDISKVRMYYGPGLMYTMNLLVLTMLVSYQMIRVSGTLAFWSMLPLPLMLICIFYINRKLESMSAAIQTKLSSLNTFVQESFSGIRVIKAFVRQTVFTKEFEQSCADYRKRSLALVKLEAIYFPVIAFLVGLSIVLTIYVGGQLVKAGQISPGVIVEFVIYINMIAWPFAAVGWVTALVQQAAVSQGRINEFLRMDSSLKNGHQAIQNFQKQIQLERVSFTYPETGIMALKNVSFNIASGSKVAIVGRTGSGKSTLAMLLTRAFDPDQGTITIDGIPINQLNMQDYRKLISLVPQDVFIFSDTIKSNILFGSERRDLEEATYFAKLAYLHHDVADFNEQYETLVGERGVTLSGGQKQRLAIARALARKPKIVILDDALSAVDTVTETQLMRNLYEVISGTVILITHRVSSIQDFDNIIVLEQGQVAEQGTHEQLMSNKAAYYNLVQDQHT